MSLKIIKAGIADAIQDGGRYGFQYLGINPGGAMDKFSMQVINALLGNKRNEAVIEMHFPCSSFLFEQDAVIAIGGADFSPVINNIPVALNRPVVVKKDSLLEFKELKNGARCYLAVKGGFKIDQWLNSYSTNTKIEAGGFHGRVLKKNDSIPFNTNEDHETLLKGRTCYMLPWKAGLVWNEADDNSIFVLPGSEWNWLNEDSQKLFLNESFVISSTSDKMGYRLNGPLLSRANEEELVSSAVCFGTIQLLADGQLIILMADHQTTGGYPKIAQVITAHHAALAQMRPDNSVKFSLTDNKTAEALFIKQQRHLLQLENACKFRLQEFSKTKYVFCRYKL